MDFKTNYLISELEDKIRDTVSAYMKDVPRPFGLVLSGGFDSGLLAALTKPDYVYRLNFPYGSKFDESHYAHAIANHLGLELEELEITPKIFKENFEPAVKTWGKATHHFSLVPLYILMKEFKYDTHILSGEGPDEYLGGYARYLIQDHLNKLYEIPELRNYHDMIRNDFKINTVDIGTLGAADMLHGHIEDMEQTMAGRFNINFHYPYINDDLAEYCYALPDDMKIRNHQTKWAFRQICKKYLPEIMWDRAKMGGPVAPVNQLMGWDLGPFDKSKYIKEQERILNESK